VQDRLAKRNPGSKADALHTLTATWLLLAWAVSLLFWRATVSEYGITRHS